MHNRNVLMSLESEPKAHHAHRGGRRRTRYHRLLYHYRCITVDHLITTHAEDERERKKAGDRQRDRDKQTGRETERARARDLIQYAYAC